MAATTSLTFGLHASTMEYETHTTADSGKKDSGTVYFGSDAVRVDNNDSDSPSSVIFQAERDVLLMLDHKNKSYTETTRGELDQLAQKTSKALGELDKQMASLPAEQREAVQNILGTQMAGLKQPKPAAKLSWKKTGTGEKIGGYACDHYEGRAGEILQEEVWAATPQSLGIPGPEMQTFQSLTTFFSDVFSKFMQGIGTRFPAFSNMKLEKDNGLEGFPLKSIQYQDGKPSEIWQVTHLDSKPVNVTKFALPDGYKKESLALPKE